MISQIVMHQIKTGYIDCLLWADTPTDENDQEIENCGISEKLERAITKDIRLFIEKSDIAGDLIVEALEVDNYYLDSIGHDFWLTRNGHGAGFWDGDLPEELGKKLTKISEEFGNIGLYINDSLEIDY